MYAVSNGLVYAAFGTRQRTGSGRFGLGPPYRVYAVTCYPNNTYIEHCAATSPYYRILRGTNKFVRKKITSGTRDYDSVKKWFSADQNYWGEKHTRRLLKNLKDQKRVSKKEILALLSS